MLIEGSKLLNYPILSLHTASRIAEVKALVVDPNFLKIVAFEISAVSSKQRLFLDVTSVREFSKMGMIVDSDEEFIEQNDVIKLKETIELGFILENMKVVTKKKTMLGRVEDFMVTTDGFQVMQLIVKRPIYKALIDPELVIGRSEIHEINDNEIIVKSEESTIMKKSGTLDFVPNFVNPFKDGKYIARENNTSIRK
ncbi:MAG: hypothetical protein ACFNPW_02470 [Candidatus Nanosyncoccus sp.]